MSGDGYIDRVLEGGQSALNKIPSRHIRAALRGSSAGADLLGCSVDFAADYHNDERVRIEPVRPYSVGLNSVEEQRMDKKESDSGFSNYDFFLHTGDGGVAMNYSDLTFWGTYVAGAFGPVLAFAATGETEFLTPYTLGGVGAANYLENNADSIRASIMERLSYNSD